MSLTINQRPAKTISAVVSDWVAAANPVLYKMTRGDQSFNQINDAGGFIQVQFTSVDISANFNVGDKVYVRSTNGVYSLMCTVSAVSYTSSTLVTMEEAYISSATTGALNYITGRPGYNVEVELYSIDGELLSTSNYSPFSNGELNIDVSAFVSAYLNSENTFDFDDDFCQINNNVFLNAYIKYTELWRGSAESQVDDILNPFYAVLAAQQIGNAPNGGNLFDYSKGERKFLTLFDEHKLFDGFPNLVSFIKDNDGNEWSVLTGTGSAVVIPNDMPPLPALNTWTGLPGGAWTISSTPEADTSIDFAPLLLGTYPLNNPTPFTVRAPVKLTYSFKIQGTTIATRNANITVGLYNSSSFVVDYKVIPIPAAIPGGEITITGQVTVVETDGGYVSTDFGVQIYDGELTDHVIVTVLSLEISNESSSEYDEQALGSVPEGVFDFIVEPDTSAPSKTIKLRDGIDDVSEDRELTTVQACYSPMMLMWRNSLGGCQQWVFEHGKDYEQNLNTGKFKRLTLFANNLSLNEWETINELNSLGEVYKENVVELTSDIIRSHIKDGQQVYVVQPDGSKIGVVVIPTVARTNTKFKTHRLDITIEYPETVELI